MSNNINELQPSSNADLKKESSLKFRTAPFGPPIVRDNEYQNPGRLKFSSKSGNAYGQNEGANFYLMDTLTLINQKTDSWASGPAYNSLATDFFTEHSGFYTAPGGPSCRWGNYSGTGNPHKPAGLAATIDNSGSGKKFIYDVGHATKTNNDMECYEYGVVGLSGLVFPEYDSYYESSGGSASVGIQHVYGMYRCDLDQQKYEQLDDIQAGLQTRLEEIIAWLEDINPGSTNNRLFNPIRSKGFKQGTEEANLTPGEYDETWSLRSLIDEVDWESVRRRVNKRKTQFNFFDPKFGRRLNDILEKVNIPNNQMGKHVLSFLIEQIQEKFVKVTPYGTLNTEKADLLYNVLEEKGSIDGKDLFNWVLRCKMGDEEYIDTYQGKFNFDNIFNWFKGIDENTEMTLGESYFLYNCYFYKGFKDVDDYGRYTCLINGQNYTYNKAGYSENYTGPVVDEPEEHAYSVAEAYKGSFAPELTDDDIVLFADTENNDNVVGESNPSIYSLEDYCAIYRGIITNKNGKKVCDLVPQYSLFDEFSLTEKDYTSKKSFRDWCIDKSGGVVDYQEFVECVLYRYDDSKSGTVQTFREFCERSLDGRYGTHNAPGIHELDPVIYETDKDNNITGIIRDPGYPLYDTAFYPVANLNERCFFDDGGYNLTGYLWNMGKRGVRWWSAAQAGAGMREGVVTSKYIFNTDWYIVNNFLGADGFIGACLGEPVKVENKNSEGNTVLYAGQVGINSANQVTCTKHEIKDALSLEDTIGGPAGGVPYPNFDTYEVPNKIFEQADKIDWDWDDDEWEEYKDELEEYPEDITFPEWNKYSGNPRPITIEPRTSIRIRVSDFDDEEYEHIYDLNVSLNKNKFRLATSVFVTTNTNTPPSKGSDVIDFKMTDVQPENYNLPYPVDTDNTPIDISQTFRTAAIMNDYIRDNQQYIPSEKQYYLVNPTTGNDVLYRYTKNNNKTTKLHDPFEGFFDRNGIFDGAEEFTFTNNSDKPRYLWNWQYSKINSTYLSAGNKSYKISAIIDNSDGERYGEDLISQYPVIATYTLTDYYWGQRFEDFCDQNRGRLEGPLYTSKKYNLNRTCNFNEVILAVPTKSPSGEERPAANPELKDKVKVTLRDFKNNSHFRDDFCTNLTGTYSVKNRKYLVGNALLPMNIQIENCGVSLEGIGAGLQNFKDWVDRFDGDYYEKLEEKDVDETLHDYTEADLGKPAGIFYSGYYAITEFEYLGQPNPDNPNQIDTFKDWCELNVEENNTRIVKYGQPRFQVPGDDDSIFPEILPTIGYDKDSFYKKDVVNDTEQCYLFREEVLPYEKFTSVIPLSFRKWCTDTTFGYVTTRVTSPGWDYDFETETWEPMPEEPQPTCFNPFMVNAGLMTKFYYDNMSSWEDLNYYCKRSNADFYRNKNLLPEFLWPVYDFIFRETVDNERGFCWKLIDIEWSYTFDEYCEKNDGELGDVIVENPVDGSETNLGYGCNFEGIDYGYLEEFWNDGADGFRFWCALNGGTNINGNNPDMSEEVGAFFDGDGCQIEVPDPEDPEQNIIKFYTYSDTGGFKLPYGEYLPYMRGSKNTDDITYGDGGEGESTELLLNFENTKDLFSYVPTVGTHVHNLEFQAFSFVYPLEKFIYQDSEVVVYRSDGENKRPTFKDVTEYIPFRLNFDNKDEFRMAVESPKSNTKVVQLWYTKNIIDDSNVKTEPFYNGPTVGPGTVVAVSIPRNYSYVYFAEINPNGDDADYVTGKPYPLTLSDQNVVEGRNIYPTNSYDDLPEFDKFVTPINTFDTNSKGRTFNIQAQKGDFNNAIGMQLWYSATGKTDGTWIKGERIEFDKLTVVDPSERYVIYALIDPTFKMGQGDTTKYLNGVGPKDSKGEYYILYQNAQRGAIKIYWTDDDRKQPNWNYYSKPFSGISVLTGTNIKIKNNMTEEGFAYPIQTYFQEAPLDPTNTTNNPVLLLDGPMLLPQEEALYTVRAPGYLIFVAYASDLEQSQVPKTGFEGYMEVEEVSQGNGNTQMIWQDEINKWSDPFMTMIDEFPDNPLDPLDETTPEDLGYIDNSNRNDLTGTKFEADSVYKGVFKSSDRETYLQMWWHSKRTIGAVDILLPGITMKSHDTETEFVALKEYAFFGSYKNRFKERKDFGPIRYVNSSFDKDQGEGSKGNATAYWGKYAENQPPDWSKYNKPIAYIRVNKGSTYSFTNSKNQYRLTLYFSSSTTPPNNKPSDWNKNTVTLDKSPTPKIKVATEKYMFVFASTPQLTGYDDYTDIENEVDWGSNGRKVVLGIKEVDNETGASGASGIEWPGATGSSGFPFPGASFFPGASWPGSSSPDGSSRPSIGASGNTDGIITGGFLFRLLYDMLNRATQIELDDLGYVASWLLAIVLEEVCIILYAIGIGEILAIVAMVIYGTEALVSKLSGKFRKLDIVAEFKKQAKNNEVVFGRGSDDYEKFCKWNDLQAKFINVYANDFTRAYLKYTFCRSNGYLFHITAPANRAGLTTEDYDKIRILRLANIANTYSWGYTTMEAPGYRKILRRYYDRFQPIGQWPPGSEGVSESDWGSGSGTKNYSQDLGIEFETALELDTRKDTIRNQPHWNEDEMWFKIDLSRAIRGKHQEKVKLRGGNYYYIGKLGADKAGDSAENQSWVNGVTESDVGVEQGAYAWNVFNEKGAGTKYKSYYDESNLANKKHKGWAWEVTAGEPDWWPIQIPEDGGIPGIEFNMRQLNIDKKNSSEDDSFRIYADWQLNFVHLTFQEYNTVDIIQDNENLPGYGEVIGQEEVFGKYRVFPLQMDPTANVPYKLLESWETNPDSNGFEAGQLQNPDDSLYMRMMGIPQNPTSGDLYTNREGVDGKIYPNYKFVGFSMHAVLGTEAHLARFRSYIIRYLRPVLWVKSNTGKYDKMITLNEARETGKYVVPNFKKDIYSQDVDLNPYTQTLPGTLVEPLLAPSAVIPTTPTPAPTPTPTPTPAPTPEPAPSPTPTPPATPPSGGYGY